jgi:hypothetical protein
MNRKTKGAFVPPSLKIEFSRQTDGAVVLRCTRDDGSLTWQKRTRHAAHFVLHDLTHYAVESCLRYRSGFFGLIAAGWNVEDTTGKGARGPIPAEAVEVERIVGLFDSERGAGVLWSLEEFNAFAPRTLTSHDVQNVRALRADLFRQWFAVSSGEQLELKFDPA